MKICELVSRLLFVFVVQSGERLQLDNGVQKINLTQPDDKCPAWRISRRCPYSETAYVLLWSEFLATDP
jgi:hypothetical protein